MTTTQSQERALLPCPFCGHVGLSFDASERSVLHGVASCDGCGATIADSWRYGFRRMEDGSLTFGFMDEGPFVAHAALAQQPQAAAGERDHDEVIQRLISVWIANTGRPVPWKVAVNITAIVKGLPNDERDRLLALDDESSTPPAQPQETALERQGKFAETTKPSDVECWDRGLPDSIVRAMHCEKGGEQ